jgi:hypothetical protein
MSFGQLTKHSYSVRRYPEMAHIASAWLYMTYPQTLRNNLAVLFSFVA